MPVDFLNAHCRYLCISNIVIPTLVIRNIFISTFLIVDVNVAN